MLQTKVTACSRSARANTEGSSHAGREPSIGEEASGVVGVGASWHGSSLSSMPPKR